MSGPAARGGGGQNGGDGSDDDDHRGGRRRHRHRYYYPDDTQLYGTSRTGARTRSGGGGTQRNGLQDECDRGYEDGLRAGEKDARRGLSSDPLRSTLYRNGGETTNRVGRTADAKHAYRDCFLRGYAAGYRNLQPNPAGASPRN